MSPTLQDNLISVVIPAFNQPGYLRTALKSILEQDYRPIEVIVSDDASPTALKPVTDEFASVQGERFRIRYRRSERNRGVIDNFHHAVRQAQGRFLVPLPHDNEFIDRGFFSEAVRHMNGRPDCHLCYGDALYQGSARRALNIPIGLTFTDGWTVMEGRRFIRLYRRGGLGWSQAIVLDHATALSLGAFGEPYVVNGALSKRLGIAQDDGFSYVFLLSAVGSVGLCSKAVCRIGTPPESYSRSQAWKDSQGKVKFIIFYNIWRADLSGRYAADARRMALKQALEYTQHILDRRIARYYGWDPRVLFMMGLGMLKRVATSLRYGCKRAVNRIRPNTFKRT